ncbi:ABC transporter substrate-binding protein [Bradyrhizobium australafricanum]|uniref:ABC transporter substrate-binding protein n=1 Tax=Bradyrhizobium australafricanum TaxID=2821406 RepID=UPI001CE263D3|nr:ABC transporter substrate-binding protein [Bradyrhizobium australafricanum]MCA6098403.1 ABC transporter substrate-binding protein [Bradyrhizobium australafricanum]
MLSRVGLGLRLLVAGAIALFATASGAAEISDKVVRLGVLTDMSGSYADIAGPGAVEAAKMAIEDFGGSVFGAPIELVVADHQNKADVGLAKAREWYDAGGVDAIFEMMASSVAIAVFEMTKEKQKIAIASGAATSALTGKNCSPFGIHWTYDTYALAAGTGRTIASQPDGNTWFFVTVDYSFGHSLEADTTNFIKEAGGTVVGSVRHPFPTSDFSSFLLQAQASKAKVVALANGGADMINSVRQAHEFGIIEGGQKIAALLPHLTDIHSLGLSIAQGIILTEGFYWDRTEQTRAWSKRFFERRKVMPTMVQAGVYSSVTHYLKAIQAAGTDDSKVVMTIMRETPVHDMFADNGKVRIDGRMVHDMYVMQVKSPRESQYPWDYYKLLKTVPGEEAFRPLAESECSLAK